MKKTEITKSLKCDLTEAEIIDFGLRMSKNMVEITKIATQKKETVSGFKAQVDELAADQRYLSGCVIAETETREVDCSIIYEWEKGQKDIFRNDTGELVESLPISESEQQEEIDLCDSKVDSKKDSKKDSKEAKKDDPKK
jgi:hypothetical protein